MSRKWRERIEPVLENMAESTTACLVTMVQGNLLVLTLGHWLIASQTGILAGTLTAVAVMATGGRNRWVIAVILGVITAIVDFFIHPGQFGPVFAEALVTGLAAAVLSYLVSSIVGWARRRAASRRAGAES